jgi:hypothetical protein
MSMAKKDRTYKIVEAGTGGPLKGNPVLGDKDGNVLPADQLLIFNKTKDGIRKVDHYRIRFEIENFSNSPLRFVPDASNVMWAQTGNGKSACPTSPCEMPGVFWVDRCDQQGKWIDVINMDLIREEFWFTLNLVPKSDPTSTNYVPVDPGGGNENNGSAGSGSSFDAFAAMTLGFGAGLVAFFGAQLLFG